MPRSMQRSYWPNPWWLADVYRAMTPPEPLDPTFRERVAAHVPVIVAHITMPHREEGSGDA